jgi:glyoxalase family protein
MSLAITRLHHVTATVADAQEDLDFYVGLLGLRLVKTTVNFDNPSVYHLYYGDAAGSPSTLMTTFPYRGWGVPPGVRGAGQIHVTSFSVPPGSIPFWRARFAEWRKEITREGSRYGALYLVISDPSGLNIELIETEGDEREPWIRDGVGTAEAIRGVHSVTLLLRRIEPTLDFATGVLGFREGEKEGDRTRIAIGEGGAGAMLELVRSPDAPMAVNGLGTVHHVAFAVADGEEQHRVRRALLDVGHPVTDVRDRQYFQSIYFREPGGVLYEVATAGPGFAIDEEPERLGEALRLPPWEEGSRRSIEAQLPFLLRP